MARVLIIDDSSFMRKRLVDVISKAGHEVVGLAADGADGVNAYKNTTPDLVVMDITMKNMDGITAARHIKDWDRGARIVFMSLVTDEDVIRQTQELGACGFIKKDEYDKLISLLG